MTKKELIEALKDYPDDAQVYISHVYTTELYDDFDVGITQCVLTGIRTDEDQKNYLQKQDLLVINPNKLSKFTIDNGYWGDGR